MLMHDWHGVVGHELVSRPEQAEKVLLLLLLMMMTTTRWLQYDLHDIATKTSIDTAVAWCGGNDVNWVNCVETRKLQQQQLLMLLL